jgi:hypothetical protein
MKCPECGSEVAPGERFCGNCGAPIEWETATPEQEELTPSGEVPASEAPDVLEAKVQAPAEEPAEEDHDLAPAPPPLPDAGQAAMPGDQEPVPPAEEETAVLPPEEEMVPPPPPAGAAPPPVSPMPPRRGQDTRWVWIIVVIVIAILALCCCGLAVVTWLVIQGSATGMIAPGGLPLLM